MILFAAVINLSMFTMKNGKRRSSEIVRTVSDTESRADDASEPDARLTIFEIIVRQ